MSYKICEYKELYWVSSC